MGAELVVEHGECSTDSHVHVKVLVGAQASAEEHVLLSASEFAVLKEHFAVSAGVDGVVGFVALFCEA